MKVYIMQLWNSFRLRRQCSRICFILTVLFFCGSVVAGSAVDMEMRIWEDASGKQVKAKYDRELFGDVQLRRPDGSLYVIPIENLSRQDLKYIRTRIPPEITVEARTRARPKERNPNYYREEYETFEDDIDVCTLTVKIRKKGKELFLGTLQAELYLVGREVHPDYRDFYRLSFKKTIKFKFPEEGDPEFETELSGDFRIYESYNYDTRGADFEGYLVVVTDAKGEKLSVKTNLNFLEEDVTVDGEVVPWFKVDELRKFREFTFFNKMCRRLSVPRPRYFTPRREF